MKGNLYVITNSVNDKVYVWKTYRTIEERFKEHILESKRERSKNRDIYKAMNTLGVDKFHINLLGQFDEGLLEEKECEYIKLYDSYRNGYNNTLGGDGKRYVEFTDEEAIETYNRCKSVRKACKELNCDKDTLSIILRKNGVDTSRYGNLNNTPIKNSLGETFNSINSASEYLIKTNRVNGKLTNISKSILRVLNKKRKTYLKLKWEYV